MWLAENSSRDKEGLIIDVHTLMENIQQSIIDSDLIQKFELTLQTQDRYHITGDRNYFF